MKRLSNRKTKNKKGIMLITTLCLLATITALSAAFLESSLTEVKAAEKLEQRMIAFHWAEGAIDQTIATLRTNASYSGVPSTAGTGRVNGNYATTVTSLGNNVYKIASTGAITGSYSVLSQNRSLEAYVTLASSSPFKMALFANQTIAMSGNAQTGSFDSSVGGVPKASGGSIGSNRAGANTISLSGNVKINGDATVGPGATVSTAIVTSGNAKVTGTKSAAAETTVLDPITTPTGTTKLGAISISGNGSQTLAAGTYEVSSITITGNGKLNISGNTTLYVTGNVNIAGNGIATAGSLPTNLRLNVKGSLVNLTGNATLYGAIYAPSAQLNISGNGGLYGGAVANWINNSGNGKVYFDKALQGGGTGTTTDVTYWAEL